MCYSQMTLLCAKDTTTVTALVGGDRTVAARAARKPGVDRLDIFDHPFATQPCEASVEPEVTER
jgi:hypothetical protein